jgi:hypothetical protein
LQRNASIDQVAFSSDGKVLITWEAAVDAEDNNVASPDNGFHFWGVK